MITITFLNLILNSKCYYFHLLQYHEIYTQIITTILINLLEGKFGFLLKRVNYSLNGLCDIFKHPLYCLPNNWYIWMSTKPSVRQSSWGPQTLSLLKLQFTSRRRLDISRSICCHKLRKPRPHYYQIHSKHVRSSEFYLE
jgi:hypothetical protein